jgi:hypothetical protein
VQHNSTAIVYSLHTGILPLVIVDTQVALCTGLLLPFAAASCTCCRPCKWMPGLARASLNVARAQVLHGGNARYINLLQAHRLVRNGCDAACGLFAGHCWARLALLSRCDQWLLGFPSNCHPAV